MALTTMQLASLARSLQAKLNNEARRRGVTADVIRKQYIFTVFLSRLFSAKPQPPWVLLGGNALLIRTGGGRFTDLDASLDETRPCLDPILSGERTSGTWDREKRAWSD